MTQTQEQMVARLRRQECCIRGVANQVGASYNEVRYYCRKNGFTPANGFGSQRVYDEEDWSAEDHRTAKKGKDLWPDVPLQVRITQRGRGQKIPQALGT